MPRWRPLPEELDPQIREFTSQLRRLVDRSGMSVATIADRTGYSKSSWERYLGGRLLPPRGATHALGDVTGTDIRHLETMWELAERAWSRDEMRHDQTMEAIRVAQAREALGEFWDDEPAKGRKWGRKEKNRTRNREKNRDEDGARGQEEAHSGSETAVKEEEWKEKTGEIPVFSENAQHQQSQYQQSQHRQARHHKSQHRAASSGFLAPPSASSMPGARTGASTPSGSPGSPGSRASADPSGSSDSSGSSTFSFFSPSASASAPPDTGRPPMDDETAVLRPRPLPGRGGRHGADGGPGAEGGDGARSAPGGFPAQRVDVSSWGAPVKHRAGASGGTSGPSRTEPSPAGSGPPAYPSNTEASHASRAAGADGHGDPDAPDGTAVPHGHGRSSRGRRVAALLGGAFAVFAVLGAGVMVFGLPGGAEDSSASPSPSATNKAPDLPAGVKCRGKSCSGKDPEKMGCGGQNVKSSNSAFVGPSMVEVRYSKVCQAAWGRITGAAQGDSLKISAKGQAESDKVDATNDAYTEMVSVGSATEARACATLVAGTTGCTKVNAAGQAGTDASAGTDADTDAGTGAGTDPDTGTNAGADAEETAQTSGTAGTGDAVP
jgi:hypothetical protein